ncbi:DNA-formamidopyrimidine glycosylase family protein [Chitinophaga sp. Cy-1792]|uniref:DNA-formamidopyrimidine glycosylase family protein n=1 Tax=Chitinophaga sp. Cy-1792 TaxID=2608339 RepID=UPI00141DBB61|nr:DNA-formamidopyrimidine glycosylase family protein [Chitinophaga sp. Cy-1792]NIG57412.1 Fpg/Nei family DNA glycosylase [Chitinophaga sp. Cy-1792]
MPELPDLEVFQHNLEKALLKKKLTDISVPVTKNLKVTVAALKKALVGQSLVKIARSGKELNFYFGKQHVLGMHMMLHGKLYLLKDGEEQKFTIAVLQFSGGVSLALTDYQRAAHITLDPPEKTAPDALSKDFNAKYLEDHLSGKKITIKKYLTDQKNVLGIGNAYADEILYTAKISPFSVAGKIPPAQLNELVKAVQKVLKDAIKKINKSHPGIINGEVRDFMQVHVPKKEKSPGGRPIEHIDKGGRTYFTDEQVLYN